MASHTELLLGRNRTPAELAGLARTRSWARILDETVGATDSLRLKLRSFAGYVRRQAYGVGRARAELERLHATTLTRRDLFYLYVMLTELSLAASEPPLVWRAQLGQAKALATAGAIVEQDAYDAFLAMAHELEAANADRFPPAGPMFERLGFWSSDHLRAFFGFASSWSLEPAERFSELLIPALRR